jgi:ATP-dependent Clp protease protease subunit
MTVHQLKPQTGYRVVNRGNDSAEIYLYGVVGGDFGGVTPDQVASDLKALKGKPISLRINSEGGSVFDGKAIYSLLKSSKSKVTTYIDGLAASIASMIAMAGDEINISGGGMMMVHNAWMVAAGDHRDFRKNADMLETVTGTLVDVYAARSGMDRAKIVKMMDAETWMTAKETFDAGFATNIVDDMKVAALITRPEAFKNLPSNLKPNARRAVAAFARMDALKH